MNELFPRSEYTKHIYPRKRSQVIYSMGDTHMEKFKKLLQQRYQLTDTRMLCALADSITFQHLDKDVKLIVEGETAANIYFLLSGIVRGFYYSENGKEITDCFVYESGDIIASDVPMNNAPSLITEETLVPCEIAALPINKIQELMSLYPEITQIYLQCLSLNLNRHREHKIALSRYCAATRYRWMKRTYPGLMDQVKKKHIASFLNITPQTMSNLRKRERTEQFGMAPDTDHAGAK